MRKACAASAGGARVSYLCGNRAVKCLKMPVQVAHNYLRQDQLFHRVLHLPVALAGVSEAVQSILAHQFGRSSLLIPNGVDCDRFFPGPATDVLPSAILSSPTKAQV